MKGYSKFVGSKAGEDGRLSIKEMFILLLLQRVKTPDSIWIIVYVLSIYPHFGATYKSKREKKSWQHQTLKLFWGKGT